MLCTFIYMHSINKLSVLNTYLIAAREKFQTLKMARTIKELGHP